MLYLPRRWSSYLVLCVVAIISLWYLSSLTDQYAPLSLSNAPRPGPSKKQPPLMKTSERFPISDLTPLPSGIPAKIPRLQHFFGLETIDGNSKRLDRLATVKASFVHSWEGYKRYAWMKDELAPVTGGFYSSFGGWSATLVDSLDTLWIMGMEEEFEEAVEAIAHIDFSISQSSMVNVFETTIRYLGGFLGAYDISNSKYPVLLEKATELGDLLYVTFDTPNRMPIMRFEWHGGRHKNLEAHEATLIAEIGSLTLELTRLAQLTGDNKYYDAIQRIMNELEKAQLETKLPGLWPVTMDAKRLTFTDTAFTLGGMADSLYEYLPKQHMLQGGLTQQYKTMYEHAIDTAKRYIFFRPMLPNDKSILISGDAYSMGPEVPVSRDPRGQHLSCFTGGMVAIGAKLFDRPDEMNIARRLVDGCIWAYDSMPSGIMPEIFYTIPCVDPSNCAWNETRWHEGISTRQRDDAKSEKMDSEQRIQHFIKDRRLPPGITDISDKSYFLRPEAIESIFILYRLTGDPEMQEIAWRMFSAIEQHTRTEIASAALRDVTVPNPPKANRMESFWLAETLKYFFLMFSEPDVVSLDDYVL